VGKPDAPTRGLLTAPLDDLAELPFAAAEIRRLEELWLRARELAVERALAEGRHREVIGELDELIAAHSLRDRLHAQRMLALYRSGRQADAPESYRLVHAVLTEQAGVEPPDQPAKRENPAVAGVLQMELGGLEPPTSWVRSKALSA
jgi:DNA-binding SARP family transcriptional activator